MIDRIRKWRLPVRYRVPPRNDLIAFALMALAFGLMVGLAIAPGWGNAGSFGPVISLPGEEIPETGTTDTAAAEVTADLHPPAGGEASTVSSDSTDSPTTASVPTSTTTTSIGSSVSTDVPVEAPDTETPSNPYTEGPDTVEPEPEETDEGPALTATVVGADDAGYAVADSSGNLLYIHYPNPVTPRPKVGKRIGTDITPVDNGTFVQDGALESKGSAASSKLSGMVSFIDPESGVITVSSRGVSVALAAAVAIEKTASPPVLGSWITASVSFSSAARAATDPASGETAEETPSGDEEAETGQDPATDEPITLPVITVKTIEAAGDPLTQIELSGPVTWDAGSGQLAIAADSFGVLNREIAVQVPEDLALRKIEDGLVYAASADLESGGTLTLAGLSANYSLKAAGDQAQAFGTHSR